MKEHNLNLLIEDSEVILLGDKKIEVKEMCASKALKALSLYKKANEILLKEVDRKDKKTSILENTVLMQKYQDSIIDLCLFVINSDNIFDKNNITKKWIYKNSTVKQLEAFIKAVLKPIIGDQSSKKAAGTVAGTS